MLLAAGFGTRLRPLTEAAPKALMRVNGRSLIDFALDRLAEAGVERVVVNLHHLGQMIRDHLKNRPHPEILFSDEPEILETGGGVVKALPMLGEEPFFVINAKIIWLNGKTDCLRRMAEIFDPARMDGLLLLHSGASAIGYEGIGDFMMDATGVLRRRPERLVAPFVYASIQICHPRLFRDPPGSKFSINPLWDRAIAEERLFGIRHDGEWGQVSSLAQLQAVERFLSSHGYAI
jgi:MurNAc alpha-1-phosphate uridylyltransferase